MTDKNIDYYMSLPYTIRLVPDEDGYGAKIEELEGCISCGDTKEEALSNIEDAKECWLRAALEDGFDIPEPRDISMCPGSYKIRMPRSMYSDIQRRAKEEGVSMNQFMVYALQRGMVQK